MKSLILYSRSYCHLCDEMAVALASYGAGTDFLLEIIDVDADTHLVALYDELVPVLAEVTSKGAIIEICHYFLDESALQAVLSCGL